MAAQACVPDFGCGATAVSSDTCGGSTAKGGGSSGPGASGSSATRGASVAGSADTMGAGGEAGSGVPKLWSDITGSLRPRFISPPGSIVF